MLKSEEAYEALVAEEAKAKAEVDRLAAEKAKILSHVVKDKAAIAAGLSETIFENLFRGEVAKQFDKLESLVAELYRLDPKLDQRLSGDRYGLPPSDGLNFFKQFVCTSLMNHRGLSDILAASKKHGDNPYLKQSTKGE